MEYNPKKAFAKEIEQMEKGRVWIVNKDWKGNFTPLQVLKSEADKTSLKQHKTEKECWATIGKIHIEPDH